MNEAEEHFAFTYYSQVFKTRMKIPWSELTDQEKQTFLKKANCRKTMSKFLPWLKWEWE